jgi:antitoxin MazE
MQVRIAKWGNSLAVRLPKAVAERLRLKEGEAVDIVVEEESLRLSPVATSRRSPTLEEMLAEMRRLGPENEPEIVDWGQDVGAEIIGDDDSRRG